MRTIKFRGKTCKDDIWVYGQYLESNISWYNRKPHKEWIVSSTISNGGFIAMIQRYPVIDETIGQYTGLQDKNGVEIYEGDIVRVSCVPMKYIGTNAIPYAVDCVCVFFQGSFLYKRISPFDKQKLSRNWTYKPMNRLDIKEVEVIGNIHDNPELLKGE